jgi:hypothetical protein
MSTRTKTATPLIATTESSSSPKALQFTKRFNVQISGTMANFSAEGPSAATWRPVEGKHVQIFTNASPDQDLSSSMNILRSAYVVKASLLEQKNGFPVPLGVQVSCIPGQEHNDLGEKFAFTSLPMTHNPMPLTLFEADASANTSQEWRKMYSEYNATNLESHNVLEVNNQNYVFVHENHPVISLLKANTDLLGSELRDDQRIDGEWFKVSKQVLSTCCTTLKAKVLTKIHVNNLMDLQVQLRRIDANTWDEQSDVLHEHTTMLGSNLIDNPYSFMARLELTYELQPQS